MVERQSITQPTRFTFNSPAFLFKWLFYRNISNLAQTCTQTPSPSLSLSSFLCPSFVWSRHDIPPHFIKHRVIVCAECLSTLKTHLQCHTQIAARQKTAIKELLSSTTYYWCSSEIHNVFIIFNQPLTIEQHVDCTFYWRSVVKSHNQVWQPEHSQSTQNRFHCNLWDIWFPYKIFLWQVNFTCFLDRFAGVANIFC